MFEPIERAFILEEYFRSNSYKWTISALETKFPDVLLPNKTTIMRMVKNFLNGIFENRTRNRSKNILTLEKLSEIKSKFEANGQTSVRKVSSQIILQVFLQRKIFGLLFTWDILYFDVWQGLWRCTHAKLAPLIPHPLARDRHYGPASGQRGEGTYCTWILYYFGLYLNIKIDTRTP